MAQATQLCTSCDTQTARDAFSEKEWEREGDVRRCLACNVHECAACGARKGPEDYPEAEWARAPGTGECRACNFRTCSRCGTRRAPDGFSHGQWDNAVDRLCIDCNKRGCSMCERLSGPEGFSTEAWDASDALRVCRTCVGKKRCGGCRNIMNRNKFSDDQWAVASQDERRCKRCAAPPRAPPWTRSRRRLAPRGRGNAIRASCTSPAPRSPRNSARKAPTRGARSASRHRRRDASGPPPPPPPRPAHESIMTYYYVKRWGHVRFGKRMLACRCR